MNLAGSYIILKLKELFVTCIIVFWGIGDDTEMPCDIITFTRLSEPASLQSEMSTVLDDYTSLKGSASVR